jgi:hypothetical protein
MNAPVSITATIHAFISAALNKYTSLLQNMHLSLLLYIYWLLLLNIYQSINYINITSINYGNLCDTAVRTQYVLPITSPVSPHILYSTHSTLCLFTSLHHYIITSYFTLCWCFTLVVNPLLTTITSSAQFLLSHNIYISSLPSAVIKY